MDFTRKYIKLYWDKKLMNVTLFYQFTNENGGFNYLRFDNCINLSSDIILSHPQKSSRSFLHHGVLAPLQEIFILKSEETIKNYNNYPMIRYVLKIGVGFGKHLSFAFNNCQFVTSRWLKSKGGVL